MIGTREISHEAGNVRNAFMSGQSTDAAVNRNTKMLTVQGLVDSALPDPYLMNSMLMG